MDRTRFADPAAEYRIHPFWFWNGEMEEAEIVRQLEEMADKGVGGVFICARQGLTVPYLSQAWFDKVRMAVAKAKELGMQVWLYDEYPYPSGIAGGEVVLEHPDAKHVTLEHAGTRARGGELCRLELPWGRILYAKASPLDDNGRPEWERAVELRDYIGNMQADPLFQKTGLTAYTQKRFFTYRTVYRLEWNVPPGEWEIAVFQEKEIEDFKYYGTFVDPCHREAMASFIRLTHERYARELGDEFGKTVKGMFTDEIGLLGRIPWSPRLAAEFRRLHGYELCDCLPALIDASAADAAKVRYDYYQTVHLLLREAYHKQVHDWCEENGIDYVAEVPAVRMATQKFSHVPGGDSAHEKLGRSLRWILEQYMTKMRANPRMVSSLGRQLGRTRNLIECFHSVGWSMTLQDAKWMIDRMAAMGTNFFNFHAFYYTMDGLAKHDAPPSQFFQNPYWEHFRALGDYTGRISYLMSEGRADNRIALLDPTTSLWTQMGNPFHGFSYGGADEAERARLERLRGDWAELGIQLTLDRFDYDHLDPELLAEAEVSGGVLRIGNAEYTALLLPPLANAEAAAWAKIRQFLQAGGTVIAVGLLPSEAIEAGSPDEREAMDWFGTGVSPRSLYWEGASAGAAGSPWTQGEWRARFVPVSAGEGIRDVWPRIAALLEEAAPRGAVLREEARCYLMQTRHLDDGRAAVFISNQEGEAHRPALAVNAALLFRRGGGEASRAADAASPLRFRELDLETGEARDLAAERTADGWFVPLAFAPYQSRVIEIEAESSASADAGPAGAGSAPAGVAIADAAAAPSRWVIPASGGWDIEPQQGNIVRFERFRLSLGGSDGAGWQVGAKTFIDQCSDLAGEQSFPLQFSQTFGTPMKAALAYPVDCAYRVRFDADERPDSCELFMDRAAISGEWTLSVNGHPLTAADFRPRFVYDRQNIACGIADFLRPGANELEVRMVVRQDWDGVIDPLYLIGSFGVRTDDAGCVTLGAAPKTREAISGEPVRGFPYYAGTMAYRRTERLAAIPPTPEFELVFADWDPHLHDIAEVRVNGRSLGVRPWTPYRWTGATSLLREGENTVEVRVTNTLAGLLDGNAFDYAAHKLEPAELRQN